MKPLTTHEMWYGRDQAPPEVIRLRAGALEVEYESGDLRYVRAGGHEIVRRVYAAVRDVNWNTIPAHMTGLKIDAAGGHFRIEFDSAHEDASIRYHWHAILEGTPDGIITYTMDGVADRDFRYCRIGFCLLHPIAGIAGSSYRAVTPSGEISGRFPEWVAPQLVENGFETPLFPPFSALTIQMPGGGAVVMDFEGDLFETEDQRNWTDGSFKTYCTPIALGYPHQARAGQTFHQKITIRHEPAPAIQPASPSDAALRFRLGKSSQHRLPALGFGMPSHGGGLSAGELEWLARLRPQHLKAELYLRNPDWLTAFERAAAVAEQIDTALELALFLTDDSGPALAVLRSKLAAAKLARVIVFHEATAGTGTTPPESMELARKHLPGVVLVGGTNGNFAELNRQPPVIAAMDGVTYAINPQVHAFDERSLIEAIAAQRDTVITARQFCGDLPIVISGVTLKQPFNPAAREAESAPDPTVLPAPVDPRQMSLFAAAWNVGSLAALASAGTASITYYETTGWRGLMETAQGSPLPDQFRSAPGMIFPVYCVFASLARASSAQIIQTHTSHPLLLDGLAFRTPDRLGVLIANLQPRPQTIEITGLPDGSLSLQRLNERTMLTAAFDPDAFEQQSETVSSTSAALELTLASYETAFLTIELA
jgi:hypothetical protein